MQRSLLRGLTAAAAVLAFSAGAAVAQTPAPAPVPPPPHAVAAPVQAKPAQAASSTPTRPTNLPAQVPPAGPAAKAMTQGPARARVAGEPPRPRGAWERPTLTPAQMQARDDLRAAVTAQLAAMERLRTDWRTARAQMARDQKAIHDLEFRIRQDFTALRPEGEQRHRRDWRDRGPFVHSHPMIPAQPPQH